MGYDLEAARKAGVSDEESAEFLAKQTRYNLQGARAAGVPTDEILTALLAKTGSKAPARVSDKAVPGSEGAPDASRNVGKSTHETGFLDKAKGAIEAGTSIVSGATTGALGYLGGALGGLAGQIRQGELGKPEGSARAAQGAQEGAERLTYTPPSEAGKAALASVGEAVEASKLAVPVADLTAATGAARAAQQLAPAARAAADVPLAAAGKAAGKVADVAAGALTPMPEPRVAALAKKAVDLGIPLRPDQLSKNPIARMVGETLEKVPLSGSKAKQRQVGFNKALGTLIGAEESDHLTPDVYDRAMTKTGERIGKIAKETPIKGDADFVARMDSAQKNVSKETRDARLAVRGYIKDLKEAIGPDGMIDGTQFRKINSELGAQIRRTSDGDLRYALSELQSDLHDVLEANIASPERLAELKDLKKKYAIGMTIQPLVAKATTTGDISPGGLLGRVTADRAGKARMARGRGGELGDLAEIGKLFLKEPASSGTAERAAAYGLVGGAGYIEPHTAAGVLGAANIYNRAGSAIVRRALRDKGMSAKETPARVRSKKPPAKEAEQQFLLRDLLASEPAAAEPLRKAVGE